MQILILFSNFKIKAATELIANLFVNGNKDSLNINFSTISPNSMVKLRENYKNLIFSLANRK